MTKECVWYEWKVTKYIAMEQSILIKKNTQIYSDLYIFDTQFRNIL